MKSPRVPLTSLLPGQAGHIRLVAELPEDLHRLAELGLQDGAEVRMFRPGNPCILSLAGSKICLRADQLLSVLVEPDGFACPPGPHGGRRRRWRGGWA